MPIPKRSFDEIFDFTRASTATYFDSDGVLQTADVDEPRFTHDPETGEALGLLIEESRTNLLLWSEDGTNEDVSRQRCTVEVSSEPSPLSGKDAYTITTNSDGVAGVSPNNFTVESGKKYTATVVVKQGNTPYLSLVFKSFRSSGWQAGGFNFDGTLDSTTGDAWEFEEQTNLGDGWLLCRASCTADQDSDSASVQIRPTEGSADTGDYIHIAHWQLEEGDGSSLIPTTDAAVTRAADNVSRELGSEFNASEGTFFVEIGEMDVTSDTPNRGVLSFEATSGTLDNSIYIFRTTSGYHTFSVRGDTYIAYENGFGPVGAKRLAVSYSRTQALFAAGGVVYSTTLSAELPDYSGHTLVLGDHSSAAIRPHLGSYISSMYYPRALTESELVDLTS